MHLKMSSAKSRRFRLGLNVFGVGRIFLFSITNENATLNSSVLAVYHPWILYANLTNR